MLRVARGDIVLRGEIARAAFAALEPLAVRELSIPVQNAIVYTDGSSQWLDLGVPPIEAAATTVTRLDDGSLLFVGQNRAVLFRY